MTIQTINLNQKFSLISEYWSPKIAGELNNQMVKLAKLKGEFVWHRHEQEDEMFLVIAGWLRMRLRENGSEREAVIGPGEFLIVPRGVEHLPVADEEVQVVLLEPASTLNTGNIRDEHTKEHLDRI